MKKMYSKIYRGKPRQKEVTSLLNDRERYNENMTVVFICGGGGVGTVVKVLGYK